MKWKLDDFIKRYSVKSFIVVAGGEPCFCTELSSSQSKEGNKISVRFGPSIVLRGTTFLVLKA